jgi:hypothetical protein
MQNTPELYDTLLGLLSQHAKCYGTCDRHPQRLVDPLHMAPGPDIVPQQGKGLRGKVLAKEL